MRGKQYRVLAALLVASIVCSVPLRVLHDRVFAAETPGRPVEVQMSNVMYHFTDTIAVHIRKLHGQLIPKGELPVFDDKQSFTIQISSAEIAMTPASLASVLNSYVFTSRDAPVKDISIHIESGGILKIQGKLHNKGDVTFETEGKASATADGKIRYHADKVRALHLPVKGLMDLFGVNIADLIKSGKAPGVQVDNDDLILDPQTLLPPPHIAGKVTEVRLEQDAIVQVFASRNGGNSGSAMPIPTSFQNYMAYRGNQLRFGKLTMTDTDLVLIDMDPKDPFDFYLDHYIDQLVAGYTKQTPTFGLRVYMRDYNKLPHNKSAANAKPAKK